MCLLDKVVAWDGRSATLATLSHMVPGNPLRRGSRLHAINLCEYGAQAMAIHGGLVARTEGRRLVAGLLVALREVELATTHIESLAGELLVEVERLEAGAVGLQYSFRVSHAGSVLARGRAAIIESRDPAPGQVLQPP
jgi:predicted hotdog family 3-hydroxylacyl-ACP dehydratase